MRAALGNLGLPFLREIPWLILAVNPQKMEEANLVIEWVCSAPIRGRRRRIRERERDVAGRQEVSLRI